MKKRPKRTDVYAKICRYTGLKRWRDNTPGYFTRKQMNDLLQYIEKAEEMFSKK
jgi:hypothetical protein